MGHPIRKFLGSGMPQGIWRRVEERFAPAKVVEFYASTEGDAVLVNVRGTKVGSLGRQLPGSADLRVARYDIEADRLVEGPDGFAVECDPGEVGMLLARLRRRDGAYPDQSLRALFEGGDAWLATGDLFTVDEDGDHWLVGSVHSLIRHTDGVTPRPRYVRVLDEIPRTTWYRVRAGALSAVGIPPDERVWVLLPDRQTYRLEVARPAPKRKAAAKTGSAAKKRPAKRTSSTK